MVMAGVILATASWLVGMATYMRVIFMLSSVITFEVNASQLQKYDHLSSSLSLSTLFFCERADTLITFHHPPTENFLSALEVTYTQV